MHTSLEKQLDDKTNKALSTVNQILQMVEASFQKESQKTTLNGGTIEHLLLFNANLDATQ